VNGCSAQATKMIEVRNEFDVFIPNSFTPNFDGVNDVFKPVFTPFGLDPSSYLLEVFDRWGHAVFSSKDINKGWDGTFQNNGDTPMKQESYVYRIRFRDLESRVYTRTGYVSLLNN
jgi:gliding motility-associated-like protein